jgi:branched-chain amino acid transport system substrate-binding protein
MKRSAFIRSAQSAAAAAAVAAAPRYAVAIGTAATVKIGFLDSFSGVFSDLAGYQKLAAQLALDDANRKGRVKYEFAYGDDGSKPANATIEARRLIGQESVDVLFGGTSSGSALAIGPIALESGVFNLTLAPFDSSITGSRATRLTYRYGPNARMATKTLGRRVLALGRKWYFVQADYALGKDAYAQLSDVLRRAGGTESGLDVVPLGMSDFSSTLTKVRNSDAEVLILTNSGLDAANLAKQFVGFGLNKRMKLAGIGLEDVYHNAVPLDALAGSTFPLLWAPNASDGAARLTRALRRSIRGPISQRHWLGYGALTTLVDRLNAAGTTKADKLAAAFDDHSFDDYKRTNATFRACDHQAIQDMYAGAIVSQATFAKTQYMYEVVAEVPAVESDGTCDSPWARSARGVLAAQTIGNRENYQAKSL